VINYLNSIKQNIHKKDDWVLLGRCEAGVLAKNLENKADYRKHSVLEC
jgi:hypothetical protein